MKIRFGDSLVRQYDTVSYVQLSIDISSCSDHCHPILNQPLLFLLSQRIITLDAVVVTLKFVLSQVLGLHLQLRKSQATCLFQVSKLVSSVVLNLLDLDDSFDPSPRPNYGGPSDDRVDDDSVTLYDNLIEDD